MKITDHFPVSANVRCIASAASKLMERSVPKDLSVLYDLLCPQWLAGYMGFKKLVEKDYRPGDGERVTLPPAT